MAEARQQGHVYLAGYKLSGKINALELTYSADRLDNTTLADTVRTSIAGHKVVDCTFSGFYEWGESPDLIAKVISDRIGSATSSDVAITHPATQAEGDTAWQFRAGVDGTPLLSGNTSGLASLSASLYSVNDDELVRSRIELVGDKTATEASTGTQVGAIASSDRATWSWHVYAFNGTSLDADLESDDNSGFTSATTRDSMTQVTAVNASELRRYTTAQADDYWRINLTFVGTSFSVVALLGGWGTLA